MDRHFACTACGKCCTRGPEMELSEATRLADVFITRLMFKLHSLPLDARSARVTLWAKREGSILPARKALAEARAWITRFSLHDETDAINERSLHLTLSALPVHGGPGCPALAGDRCGIYARRPACCGTVPFHYSRAPSTLGAYLDAFVRTPGHACDTSKAAPKVLRGGALAGPALVQLRGDGVALAAADRPWKAAIAALVRSADAGRAGLPSYAEILRNAATGATTVPMLAAWRVARREGFMTVPAFEDVCRKQTMLLRAQGREDMFRDMLADFQ
ncbi:MAG: YkgJ family cysteine cluster protein [Rhodospirillaceae bacterium]|nr:YkgJ family cysteine cluster protein [Rhodospirillaceae bacterium]